MIDLAVTRAAYRNFEIDNVALIRSEFNYADDLTKTKGNGALFHLLKSGKINQPVENFVVTPKSNTA